MAASAIIISSDSSDESVGSPPSRVILFGDIPTVIPSTSVVAPETSTIAPVISPAAPMVETTLVASPTRLCGLVPYTGSDSDSPDKMSSPEHISPLPAISPFICTDSSEAPDSSDGPPLQDPYVTTIARWRSRVTTRPSSSHEFPTAPPGIRRRLASRHASHRSPDHHSSSSSSSSDSSPVHSLGLDASDQAHSGSSTRDVSPRLCYPPRRAPRCSEAFRRWCAAPLSTWYPPTTSESSSGDSSERPMHLSSHSAGPSRKRCRSPVDSVPLSMPVTGSLAPTRADLLPPRKRFRDSYSSEASLEEDAEVGLTGTGVDMELGISDGDEVGIHVGGWSRWTPVMPEDPYAYVVAAFQAPSSPDYVPGLECPPLLEFVPEPVYPEFKPPEDDSDPEEDPVEDDDEDPKEDPTDYPTDKDDDDEEEEEPFGDEADDKEEDKDDKDEEEENPALVDCPPTCTPYSLTTTTSITTPPASPTYPLGYRAAMIWLRAEAPSTSYSLLLPPPIILSRTKSDAPPSGTPPILPIPLPTSSPSLLLPSTDHGADRPKVFLPPRKRLCFAFGPRYEVEESSSTHATRPTRGFRADYGFIITLDREIRRDPEREVGYGITNTWDEMLEDMQGEPTTDKTELGRRMTNFVTTVRQDTDEIYVRLGEAQDERSLISGQLNLLQRDRRTHAHTTLLMEREARLSHEAWGRSMDARNLTRSEVMALRTQVVAQQSKIAALRAADRARQA
ncbi:hypothetical protein Tco_0652920 [Tanacetum coccineum]|uniref:Uncharacterized protein n=1 Tax=Tanacetum coccineum TaxID=301880 RepID=A0ABQ4WYV8_9ASTR